MTPHARTWKTRQRMATDPERVSAVGAARRVRALRRIGYPLVELAQITGLSYTTIVNTTSAARIYRDTHTVIALAYDRLQDVTGPSHQTEMLAANRGVPGPWSWTPATIDDPDALPAELIPEVYVDEVFVARVARDGVPDGVRLTRPERMAALQLMKQRGVPVIQIMHRLHLSGSSYAAYVRRLQDVG